MNDSEFPPIKVWHFYDAPEEYRALSGHGGDEDWLAFVPDEVGLDWQREEWAKIEPHEIERWERDEINDPEPAWLRSGTNFGRCDTSVHRVVGGWVYIGAHS